MAGASAVILHAWHVPLVPPEPVGPVMGATAPPEDEPFHEEAARRVAEEGATYASQAGLAAQFELRRAVSAHDIAEALLQAAEDHDAAVIVSGRRGMSRLKSALLGSVSDALVREARRPLLIVPSPDS
jgi:nucleotide-binding universal stress UspA family protein